ncbi:hypothetical protein FS749_006143, partial [Ceratobasidium sp. UAMH 11750]
DHVFKHYYGCLCVHCLFHITCLAVLRETKTMDVFLETLDRGASWNGMSRAAAFAALNRVGEATMDAASLEDFCKIFTRPCFFVDGREAVCFAISIAAILWSDRDNFLILYQRGLLPGCALLLLAALKLLPSGANVGVQH